MDKRLRLGQFPKSSSVEAMRKEVVARGRSGVLLLFNSGWELSLRKDIKKVQLLGVFGFFPLECGRNVGDEYILGLSVLRRKGPVDDSGKVCWARF